MESLSKYGTTTMQNNCEQYVKNCLPYHSKHFLQINAPMWHGIIHKSCIAMKAIHDLAWMFPNMCEVFIIIQQDIGILMFFKPLKR